MRALLQRLGAFLSPNVRFHNRNVIDESTNEKGWPREAVLVFRANEDANDFARFEWAILPRGHRTVGIDFSVDPGADGPPISLNVHLGFAHGYFSVGTFALAKRLWPRKPDGKPDYGWERGLSIGVHDWAAWWRVWAPRHEWSCETPRWRDGSWHPFGFPGEAVAEGRIVEEREVLIPFPNHSYVAIAKHEHRKVRSRVFPLLIEMRSTVDLRFEDDGKDDEDQCPVDHKGRGIRSWSCPARTIEEAIGKFVGSHFTRNSSVHIVVNAKSMLIHHAPARITFERVVHLANMHRQLVDHGPWERYTVVHRHPDGTSGIMLPGAAIPLRDGTIFNVAETGQA